MKNKSLVALSLLVFPLPAFTAETSTLTQSFKKGTVNDLALENASGEVSIEVTDKEPTVQVDKLEWTNEDCSLNIQENSGTLTVEVKKHASWKSWFSSFITGSAKCLTKVHVKVPEQTDLSLVNGAGKISAVGVQGTYDIKVGSGDVTINDARGSKLAAQIGSGSLTAKGEFAAVDVKVGTGKINFENGIAPLGDSYFNTGTGDVTYKNKAVLKAGLTDIKTGTGDIQINLPKDSELSVSFKSGVGRVSNDFASKPGKHTIVANSGVGSLTVKKD